MFRPDTGEPSSAASLWNTFIILELNAYQSDIQYVLSQAHYKTALSTGTFRAVRS